MEWLSKPLGVREERRTIFFCLFFWFSLLLVRSLSSSLGSLVSSLSHRKEDLIDVGESLGASLDVAQLVKIGEFLGLLGGHLTIQVRLQTDQKHGDRLASVLLDLFHPLFDVLEGGVVGSIEAKEEAFSLLVLRARDESVLFLTGSIQLFDQARERGEGERVGGVRRLIANEIE